MLAFNVAQLLKEGVGASRQRALSGNLSRIDELNPGPVDVNGDVTLVRTPSGVLVLGRAEMTLQVACRRCLEPVTLSVSLDIEEEFVPSIDVVTGRPVPVDADTTPELVIDERHTLDLTEALWQYAVSETMRPVYCSSDCKGLCPQCGANLNLGPCGCQTVQIDPRLALLAQLLGPTELDKTEQGEEE